jgi:predicted nucleic-acid-binding Zn-ribbon protein
MGFLMVMEEEAAKAGTRKCTYCKAEEHKVRPIGNFVVNLTEVQIDGIVKYACQSCKVKVAEAREAIQKMGY